LSGLCYIFFVTFGAALFLAGVAVEKGQGVDWMWAGAGIAVFAYFWWCKEFQTGVFGALRVWNISLHARWAEKHRLIQAAELRKAAKEIICSGRLSSRHQIGMRSDLAVVLDEFERTGKLPSHSDLAHRLRDLKRFLNQNGTNL
jgi:hypothetical protein